jgi:recombination protein RecA
MYGKGISRVGEVLDLATQLDIINKSGAWFSYGETRLGQGRDNVKLYMQENPDFTEDIARQVMERKDDLNLSRKGKGAKGAATPAPAPAPVKTSASNLDIEVDEASGR